MLGLAPRKAFSSAPALFSSKAATHKESLSISMAELLGGPTWMQEFPRPQNYLAMERKYGTSAWVYVCTRRKARDISSAPVQVLRKSADDDLKPVPDAHDLVQLFRHVNPWMTMVQLIQMTSIYLDLTGNAFWLVARDGNGVARELYPLNPFSVRIFGSDKYLIDHYILQHLSQLLPFRAWRPGQSGDILHFKLSNPASDLQSAFPSVWGVGPLEAAWNLVITDEDAVKWNRSVVKNDGRPAGILTSDQTVSPVEAQAAAEEYRKVFGGPNNAGKILVVGKNLKYERVAVTPKELDYKEARAQLREEILAAFGLNSAVLGLAQGDVGRRSEAHKEYWRGTVVSTSESDLMPPLNEFLAAEYGTDLVIKQDFSNIPALQENEEELVKVVKGYWDMGISFNVLNKHFELGFEDVEGGEVGFVSATLQPITVAADPPDPLDMMEAEARIAAENRPKPEPREPKSPVGAKVLEGLRALAEKVSTEMQRRG